VGTRPILVAFFFNPSICDKQMEHIGWTSLSSISNPPPTCVRRDRLYVDFFVRFLLLALAFLFFLLVRRFLVRVRPRLVIRFVGWDRPVGFFTISTMGLDNKHNKKTCPGKKAFSFWFFLDSRPNLLWLLSYEVQNVPKKISLEIGFDILQRKFPRK